MSQLTKQEIIKVLAWYHATWEPEIIKPFLKPLLHLTNTEIVNACRAYDQLPFMFVTKNGSNITVEPINETNNKRIVIEDASYVYGFNGKTGAIALYKGGKLVYSQETQLQLTQHYFLNKIAIPLYFDYGHWANGKTAIELGIAAPDRFRLFEALNKKFNKDRVAMALWMHEQEIYHKVDFNDLAILDEKIVELSAPGAVV